MSPFSFKTALLESLLWTIIRDVYCASTPTNLHFSQVLHSIITPKLILTNPNHPQCHGTQSTSCPTPTNTKPTLVTPPALRDHLACPSDSQNNLTDPRPNTDCLPGHHRR